MLLCLLLLLLLLLLLRLLLVMFKRAANEQQLLRHTINIFQCTIRQQTVIQTCIALQDIYHLIGLFLGYVKHDLFFYSFLFICLRSFFSLALSLSRSLFLKFIVTLLVSPWLWLSSMGKVHKVCDHRLLPCYGTR